ncbi:hypothetical protein EGY16_05120 [Burkholderia pseudomallei]|nr:hypothetical protein [Burkholderia pseudomallei]AYX27606.1 hypothetical protein EGY16_05120 [Burkholderia pseudomallei]
MDPAWFAMPSSAIAMPSSAIAMPSSAIDKPGRAIDPRALPNRHGRQPASRLAHRPPAAPGSRHAL